MHNMRTWDYDAAKCRYFSDPTTAYLFRRQVLIPVALLVSLFVLVCVLLKFLLTTKPCILLVILLLWSV